MFAILLINAGSRLNANTALTIKITTKVTKAEMAIQLMLPALSRICLNTVCDFLNEQIQV